MIIASSECECLPGFARGDKAILVLSLAPSMPSAE